MSGWMKAEFVTLQGDPADLPYLAVINADIITGHVLTTDGIPASGIGISLAKVNLDLGESFDAVLTDVTGTFYMYVPKGTSGAFNIGVNSYNCEGNLMVGKCELPYILPPAQLITLPVDPTVTFEFVLTHN
jgi:hypothetical protein